MMYIMSALEGGGDGAIGRMDAYDMGEMEGGLCCPVSFGVIC